ncbi:MAG TPA: Gfo/Idh/MocA family oxidoreductase, partial [Candidatus Sulfotelmatobacter sp.]|nr:Gfo/Idh/MocA family oxidoreductase [Candidatus Sulfotelmatobacter sp.]
MTAVSTSRQETADETAKHFGIPYAFADPYKMVQHPDVDLVAICVRVPFHHQLGMAALNAGKHLYCEWPLVATTEQAQQMRDLAVRKGVHHMVGLQARGAREFNYVRGLVAEGYVGKVLSCTMIITTCLSSIILSPLNGNVKMSPHETGDIHVESEGTAASERNQCMHQGRHG